MDHHQAGISLEDIVIERDDYHDCSRRRVERKPGEAFEEGG